MVPKVLGQGKKNEELKSEQNFLKNCTAVQHLRAWTDLPGLRYGKLFIGRPSKKKLTTY